MRIPSAFISSGLALVTAAAAPAGAQEKGTAIACRDQPCGVLVDWGAGGVPVDVDRRYGAPTEFEGRLVEGLARLRYHFVPDPGADVLRVRVRPRMTRAICDRLPGTNTDMSCNTIGEVRIDFMDAAADLELPENLRIRNRCGNGELMDIAQFSRYVVEMLDHTLSRDEDRKRPTAKC